MTDYLARLKAALVDRYRIERELGAGGMATVYLAEDLKHHRHVAVKVFHPELAALIGAERFLAEIRTTANLQHPHILPLHDSGQADVFLFYVMPYVEGETLRARLNQDKQLPVDEALRITREVASALDYAHRHGVIHRDIKPENILLHEGRALIADFGIALAVSSAGGQRMTQTGMSLGTPEYMSPEQALGERTITAKSDIYALGCVLYEMLTGEPPFTGATVQAVMARAMNEEPRPISHVRKTVPPQVEAAVVQALAKLPADRFASAEAFERALLPGVPGSVPAGTSQQLRRAPSLVGWGWKAAAGLLLMAAFLGWSRALSPASGQPVQWLPVSLESPPRSRSVNDHAVKLSNDGMLLMYLTSNGHHVLDLRTGRTTRLTDERTGLSADFSPTGDSVVIRSASWLGQLWIVERATGRTSLLADSALNHPRWADDGWVYFQDLKQGLRRVNPADRVVEVLVAHDAESDPVAENPVPVPGTTALIFTRRPSNGHPAQEAEIVVIERSGATAKILTRGVDARFSPTGHLLFLRADGSLFASAFDRSALQLEGTAAKVLDSVLLREGGYLVGSFAVSREGSVLYVKAGRFETDTLAFLDRLGRVGRMDTNWGGWVGSVDQSRDGRRWTAILNRSLRGQTLWVREDSGTAPRALFPGPRLDHSARFLNDGNRVAFGSPRGGGNWDLYAVRYDGSSGPERILDRTGDIVGPRFAVGSEWVVFCERGNLGEEDVLMHRFGSDSVTVAVATSPSRECTPDISPDGGTVAYQSDASGRFEVYLRQYPAPARGVSLEGGRQPRFSTDGAELYFLDPQQRIMSVPLDRHTGLPAGTPRPLFTLDARATWLGDLTARGEFVVRWGGRQPIGRVMLVRGFSRLLADAVK